MALPHPIPDDPRKWDGWAKYKSLNYYERLGLAYDESPGPAAIEESCRQLLLWWQKKLPLKSQPGNPLAQLLGKAIDEAPRLITEAKLVLLNPAEREAHDRKLSESAQAASLFELRKFIDFALKSKLLTPSDEQNLLEAGEQLGLAGDVIAQAIEEALTRTGAQRGEPAPSVSPVPRPPSTVPLAPSSTPSSAGGLPPDPEGFKSLVDQWKEKTDFGELEDEDRETLRKFAANFRLNADWAEAILEDREYDPEADAKKAAEDKLKQEKLKAAMAAHADKKSVAAAAVVPKFNPDQERRDFPNFDNEIGMPMITIPSGSFMMGSNAPEAADNERPAFQVILTGYWISKYCIANIQYELFDPSHISKRLPGTHDDDPVVFVSWEDARKFCEWLGNLEGKKYRLPTEAEWEYAARGPKNFRYPWGDKDITPGLANFADARKSVPWADHSMDCGYATTAPAASFPMAASPFGIEDMAGNVWEWTCDALQQYKSQPCTNPMFDKGEPKALRGGSWRSKASSIRTTSRAFQPAKFFSNDIGFRVVCVRNGSR
ncbi:MAG: formylglycine-generating enzyme family protein [Verrucomicrobiae bacterium]|nr:formylglycine-generating enzyme family protein [Verrucomicrobiae bacterium]